MRQNHEKIDFLASAMLLFNIALLLSAIVQYAIRDLFILQYPDYLLAILSIVFATLITRRRAINAVSRIIHWFFNFDV